MEVSGDIRAGEVQLRIRARLHLRCRVALAVLSIRCG